MTNEQKLLKLTRIALVNNWTPCSDSKCDVLLINALWYNDKQELRLVVNEESFTIDNNERWDDHSRVSLTDLMFNQMDNQVTFLEALSSAMDADYSISIQHQLLEIPTNKWLSFIFNVFEPLIKE
jgi:hypothetical protein